MQGFFLTGTDTDVGKTFVAAALLTCAAEAGLRTAALKPLAAGAHSTPAGWRNNDGLVLQAAVNTPLSYSQVNPLCLAPAIAPHLAARDQGVALSVAALVSACQEGLNAPVDWLLVEGAGGWRVPISDEETLADLARELGFPVILVVAMRLGCINHALLSAEAIRADGLKLAGWVANSVAGGMSRQRDNIATLRHRLGAPLLGEVPWLAEREGEGKHEHYRRAAAYLSLPAITS